MGLLNFFSKAAVWKLHPEDNQTFMPQLSPMLLDNEQIICTYKTIRDGVVFTNMRLFVIDVQGITGKNVSVTIQSPTAGLNIFRLKPQVHSISTASLSFISATVPPFTDMQALSAVCINLNSMQIQISRQSVTSFQNLSLQAKQNLSKINQKR